MTRTATGNFAKVLYKEWSPGRPAALFRGWPLGVDAQDDQLHFLVSHGFAETHRDQLNADLLDPPRERGC